MHGCREHIVGRLGAVNVVVRMDWLVTASWLPGQLISTVGDDFVQVHVGLGTASGLPDAQRELRVMAPFDDLVASLNNQLGTFVVKFAKLLVGKGCSFFDQRKGMNQA